MTAAAVSDETFAQEVLQSKVPVLVDFYADWCQPCKAMAPTLDRLADQLQGKVKIVKLDIVSSPVVSTELGIRALPTLILFKDGKPAGRHLGAVVQKEKLEEKINAMLAEGAEKPLVARATRIKLENGMDVVVVPDHRAPDVTHMLLYRVGAADAPQGKSGVAKFVQHLMSKSLAESGRRELAQTGQDVTTYHQRVSVDRLESVMAAEAQRMLALGLTNEGIAEELRSLAERWPQLNEAPGARLRLQMNAAFYRSHPYGIPVVGNADDIAGLSSDDVIAFHKRYYAPNNAILVICGDITSDEAKRLAEQAYGGIPANSGTGARGRARETPSVTTTRITLTDANVRSSELHRIYAVPSYATAKPGEAHALELLTQIVGNRSTGRLNRQLVDAKLAARTEGSYSGSSIASSEIVLRVLDVNDVEAVEAGVDAVLDNVRANGVSESELERTKKMLTADFHHGALNSEMLARRYGPALAAGRSIESIEGWPEALAKVTTDDIRRVAGTYLDPSHAATGWLLPEKADSDDKAA